MKKKVVIVVFALSCLLSLNVFALNGSVEGEKVSDAKYMADTLWVLVAAFLVFFMQAGFAMVESGFTRAKNAVNILMEKPNGLLDGDNRRTGQSALLSCLVLATHSSG